MQDNLGIILIVDDEASVLSALRRELLTLAPVMIAQSASEAYKILDSHNISVVLSDYKMPDVDGISFLSQIRETHPQVTRLLFTAYSGEELLIEAVNRAGIFHFIKKPWESGELKLTMERALDFNTLNKNIVYYKQRLEKMEDIKKGSMSLISHELKTPLTVVKGYADMIEPYILDDVEKLIYKRMQESLDRLQSFIDHVVDIVSVEKECPDTVEKVEISSLIASLFENYHPQKHYNIDTKRSLLITFLQKFSTFIKDKNTDYTVSINEAGNYLSILIDLSTEKTYRNPQLPLFEALEPNCSYINYDGEHNLELGYAKKAIQCLDGEFYITPQKKALHFEILLPLQMIQR